MKKIIHIAAACIAFLLSLNAFESRASHAAGGELIYKWVSDSTYRFYFKFYRDCTGLIHPNSVVMCYTNTCTFQSYNVTLDTLAVLPGGVPNGSQVATGCANQPSKCQNTSSPIPGYREWWYSAEVTLNMKCNYWKFGVSINARNPSVNIVAGTFYVETTLNNQLAQGNSSPDFSVKPVPYVCLNQFYKYNNGGVDPDGDSVAFQVVNPLDGSNCLNPTLNQFNSGSPIYTIPSNPFQTNNSFNISATSGEMSFTPGLLGAQTVAVKATEYRNGVVIGSVMRDIQVQVVNCNGSGVTPTLTTDSASVTGSGIYSNGNITACATKPFTFCFDIKSTDTAAKLVVTDNSGAAMPGSVVSYSNLQTDSVRGCVTWTPSPTDTGNRVYVVTVKDSSCTSTGVAISHSITVPVYVWAVTQALKDTSICTGDSTILIGLGGTAYTWSVVPGGSPITSLSCTNCKSPVAKPTATTSYIVNSNSAGICNQNIDTVTVTVIQQGVSATSNSPVCPGDTVKLFAGASGVYYSWTGPNGFTSALKNPVIPNASSVNSGFYGLSVNNGTCASQVFNLQVLVDTPAGPNASSNSPLCEGSQLILTATTVAGTNVTYHWSGPNGFTSTQQIPMVTATTAHAGKYYLYATKDGCVTRMDSVVVVVTAIPANPVVTPDTIGLCQSVAASPLTATGTNLLWYTTPTGGSGIASLTPSTANAGVFHYYVSQTVGTCESQRDTATVIITAKPATPSVVTNQAFCQHATIGPLSATGTNIKWYVVPSGGAPLSTPPTPSTATPGNTIFFVSQTNGTTGCESDRVPVIITIHPTPAPPSIVSPLQYCVGGPATPSPGSQVSGTNVKWYTTPAGGSGSTTAPVVNTSVARVDTYYVSQTLNSCEGTRGMMIIQVLANPAPPQTSNIAYCQYAAAIPLTANGQNLLWYTAATGGTGSINAPTPSTATPGTFTYYVSQTISNCESMRDSIVVTVHPEPALPDGHNDSVCQYSTPMALTAAGTNILWYTAATGGTGISIPPSQPTHTPGTYYWYASQTINGCESDRDTVEIEVVKQPDPPTSDSQEYCLDGVAQPLTAVGQNLLWYTVPTGGSPLAGAPTPNTSVTGYTNYYVSQTLFGCESPRDTLTVEVDTLVSVDLVFSNKFPCVTDSIEVSQNGKMPDSSTFTWTWGNAEIISGDTSGPYFVKWNTPGVKIVTVSAENNGCHASDFDTVDIQPLPEAVFEMKDEICVDEKTPIILTTPYKATYAYNWSFGGNTASLDNIDSTGYLVSWNPGGQQVVWLRVISDFHCVSPLFTDTINVRDNPDVTIEKLEHNTICTKTEIALNANSLAGLHKYKWEPAEYFYTNGASAVTAVVPSSGYISVAVTDDLGCTGMDSIYVGVKLCCKAILPSAFSPNNDGKNDKFGIISRGNYKISAFRIVNRYGREVFSTNNQHERWDGTYNGQLQGIGTYYYYIKYSCEDDDADNEVEERGDVTLIR